MEMVIKSRARQVVEARTGRDLVELLRDLYLTQRLTQQEIADLIKVHRVTVTKWLDDFEISRDDRPAVTL